MRGVCHKTLKMALGQSNSHKGSFFHSHKEDSRRFQLTCVVTVIGGIEDVCVAQQAKGLQAPQHLLHHVIHGQQSLPPARSSDIIVGAWPYCLAPFSIPAPLPQHSTLIEHPQPSPVLKICCPALSCSCHIHKHKNGLMGTIGCPWDVILEAGKEPSPKVWSDATRYGRQN